MYCIANICYVCLQKKHQPLSNINSSLAVNQDIIHIIGYLPLNLAWLKTDEIILICEECCMRLRETYRFHVMCLRNSALLRSYKDNLKSTSVANTASEAELTVMLNVTNKHTEDMTAVECEIKLEPEEMCDQIVEEPKDLKTAFVKEEEETSKWEVDTCTWDEPDVNEGHPMDNASAECKNNESIAEISELQENPQTNTGSSGAAVKKFFTCAVCGKSFVRKTLLTLHSRVHTHEKPYKCSTCNKCFSRQWSLVIHTRIHTDSRPYTCSSCGKSFRQKPVLNCHMRIHTGEKPFECSVCQKSFRQRVTLVKHMRVHTGKKQSDG